MDTNLAASDLIERSEEGIDYYSILDVLFAMKIRWDMVM